MSEGKQEDFDVIIVGSGMVGANIAKLLVEAELRVLMLEAGPSIGRSREAHMENYLLSTTKNSSYSPYPPDAESQDPANTNAPRASVANLVNHTNPTKSYLTYTDDSMPFAGAYERIEGGSSNSWQGTSLRMTSNDLRLRSHWTETIGLDWPLSYNDLEFPYRVAEQELGVAGNVSEQEELVEYFGYGYEYPMPSVPLSLLDTIFAERINDQKLTDEDYGDQRTKVISTPAARNTRPYRGRRACVGSGSCSPICPIQAKYDATITLASALKSKLLEIRYQTVVDKIMLDEDEMVSELHYINYADSTTPATKGSTGSGTVKAPVFVLAANAIENAKILLNSPATGKSYGTVANSSELVGCHLMDHLLFHAKGLMRASTPIYPYRGPLSTAGIENLRDGPFRANRAAWRIEIGNDGWSNVGGDPYLTVLDFIDKTNHSGLNIDNKLLYGLELKSQLNFLLTRQFRFSFQIEQDADPSNRVQLSDATDKLGIPRPMISYKLSDYAKRGFASAATATKSIMKLVKATDHTKVDPTHPCTFSFEDIEYNYAGAGHICGTHIMGSNAKNSVVDSFQRSWNHSNLFLAGGGSMPSIGAQDPSLTMVALGIRTAKKIIADFAEEEKKKT